MLRPSFLTIEGLFFALILYVYAIAAAFPSNYIINPAIEDLDGTVENEAFCMALAREIGLDVPRTFIYQHEKTRVLSVKRFDRLAANDGTKRLHQEDFCQALRILPEYKYEAEGGTFIGSVL